MAVLLTTTIYQTNDLPPEVRRAGVYLHFDRCRNCHAILTAIGPGKPRLAATPVKHRMAVLLTTTIYQTALAQYWWTPAEY